MDDQLVLPPDSILYAEDSRGIYIPQHFAESIEVSAVRGLSDWHWDVLLAGPEHENYWYAWDEVLNKARVVDSHGEEFYLYQDGDLWLVPISAPVYDAEKSPEAFKEPDEYAELPEYYIKAVWDYVYRRAMPGHFITRVLENDLSGAVSHADSTSLRILPLLVRYIYNRIPAGAWGSPEKVRAWWNGES